MPDTDVKHSDIKEVMRANLLDLLGQMVALKQREAEIEEARIQTAEAMLRTDGGIATYRTLLGQSRFNEIVEEFNAKERATVTVSE
ncbi:MAG: hypothetical protein ACPL7K_02830 [Armatimonadota bacterium]